MSAPSVSGETPADPRRSMFRVASLPFLLAGLLAGLVFWLAIAVSGDLDWPPESDFYRDMGSVEALAAGDWFADPNYPAEFRWYNPLTHAVVAALYRLTDVPLPILYARVGPYLNLAGLIAFFVLARTLLGRWEALAALVCYLFLNDFARPSWFTATYSAWLWPCHFTQGLAYATVIVYALALRRPTLGRSLATGLLLGLTFLSHTAPALVLAGTVTGLSLWRCVRDPARRGIWLRQLLLIGGCAFLVSLPHLGPLLFKYRLRTPNDAPANFAPLDLAELCQTYQTPRTLIALLGLAAVLLMAQRGGGIERRTNVQLLLALTGTTAVFLGYAALAQEWGWRRMVPLFHFQIYTKAVEAVLFGAGLVAVCNLIVLRLGKDSMPLARRLRQLPLSLQTRFTLAIPLLLAALLLITITAFPGYLGWLDRVHYRRAALHLASEHDRLEFYHWLRRDTRVGDVFLVDYRLGLYAVAAANRPVVCMDPVFSSPFVDFRRREADCRALFRSLRTGDAVTFERLADVYQVSYVVANDAERAGEFRLTERDLHLLDQPPLFELVFRSGPIRVYRRR